MSSFKSPITAIRSPLSPIDANKQNFNLGSRLKSLFSAKKEIKEGGNALNESVLMYSMAQIGDYDGNMHLPKYSQSEMDAVMEENQLLMEELKTKLNQQFEKDRVTESAVIIPQDHSKEELESLRFLLDEEKSKNQILTLKIDEYCLMRTQNKALNHRLETLELEMAERCADYENRLAMMASEEKVKSKQMKDKYESDIASMYENTKREIKQKAQAQFEAGNAKFNQAKEDFKELRLKYDERVQELSLARNKADLVQLQLDSEAIITQARITEIEDLMTQIEVLKKDKSALISASVASQSNVSSVHDNLAKLKDELFHEQQKASELNVVISELENQLACSKMEINSQSNVIAKLTSAKNAAEKAVEVAQTEVREVTSRCHNLREMNKEMLAMLEGHK